MRTLIIIVYAILMPLGALIALISAINPGSSQQGAKPRPPTVEQERRQAADLARLRADPCLGPFKLMPDYCPGKSDSGSGSPPLADRLSDLESRVTTLESE